MVAAMMMSQDNVNKNWKRNSKNVQESLQNSESKDVDRILSEIKKELRSISKEQRGAIRDAIHEAKKGSRESLPLDVLRQTMREAVGLE
jgi:hypothetical protein